ncbi:hypothetical protein ABK040_014678 [Willaertia magna]
MPSAKNWFPLESNPDLMNSYVAKLGLGENYGFHDVYGLDDELLDMVPKPVVSVLLLFPLTKENQVIQQKEDQNLVNSNDVFFMKQTIGNACGTIAMLHAVVNNKDKLDIKEGFLKDFIESAANKTPEERAKLLEEDTRVEEAHEGTALSTEAQSTVVEDTNLHFVSFVCKNNTLYEMDGRRNGPMPRGPTTPETLLKDAVKVVKHYMEINPNLVQFNLVALAKNE